MSEHTPITGELRDAMRQWGWVEMDGSITITTSPFPPSIDAEQSLAISGSEFDRLCDAIDSVHANLERENEALRNSAAHAYASGYEYAEMDREGWVRLPVDADGVPIRVGDLIRSAFVGEVLAIELRKDGWHVHTDQWSGHDFDTMHHHAPTVEDVLREFYVYAERGKEHRREDVDDAVLAEYAKRLQLAGEDA